MTTTTNERQLDEVTLENVTSEELARFTESDCERYDYYGLPIITIDGNEYAVALSSDDADEACKEYIKQTVWAFNADFLSSYMADGRLTAKQIEALRGDSCEDCNDAFLAMIDDFDDFADDAMSADGRGHFLSSYDGDEVEIGDCLLYRIG